MSDRNHVVFHVECNKPVNAINPMDVTIQVINSFEDAAVHFDPRDLAGSASENVCFDINVHPTMIDKDFVASSIEALKRIFSDIGFTEVKAVVRGD
jgi:hypothetical protein